MILVTGATGLLGSYLVQFLIENNYKVKALIRKSQDKKQFAEHKNLFFALGNILDISTLEDAFKEIEYVYHCAGFISFSPLDKKTLYNINVIGTANIVNSCIDYGIKKMCHVSSVAAIGKAKGDISNEETIWDNSSENTYYGYTKYLGEIEAWRGVEEGLNVIIVNPSVILGAAKWNSPSMNIFKYVKNENKYFTNGGNNFIDVRDLVRVMFKLMDSSLASQRFIIAGKRTLYKELFKLIGKEFGVKPPTREAKKWMLNIAWRYEYLKSKLFNKKPLITKETVRVSNREHEYSSKKIVDLLNIKFTSIEDTIQWTCNKL